MSGILFYAGSGWADEKTQLASKFHSQLTWDLKDYHSYRNTKALAACIDWSSSTSDYLVVQYRQIYHTGKGSDGQVFVTKLMNSALNACENAKKSSKLNCDCVPVDKNGTSVLLVPQDLSTAGNKCATAERNLNNTTTPQISTYADGLAAYNLGDYTTALEILKPLACEGQPDAAYILGEIYHWAQGMPQDYSEAYYWYSIGGRLGNPRAQMMLSSLVGGGLGVARNDRRSLEWYQCVLENEKSSLKDRDNAKRALSTAFSVHNISVECHL